MTDTPEDAAPVDSDDAAKIIEEDAALDVATDDATDDDARTPDTSPVGEST